MHDDNSQTENPLGLTKRSAAFAARARQGRFKTYCTIYGRSEISGLRSVRESRRGGRDATRPNVPGSKRNKPHDTSTRDHERSKVDRQR